MIRKQPRYELEDREFVVPQDIEIPPYITMIDTYGNVLRSLKDILDSEIIIFSDIAKGQNFFAEHGRNFYMEGTRPMEFGTPMWHVPFTIDIGTPYEAGAIYTWEECQSELEDEYGRPFMYYRLNNDIAYQLGALYKAGIIFPNYVSCGVRLEQYIRTP